MQSSAMWLLFVYIQCATAVTFAGLHNKELEQYRAVFETADKAIERYLQTYRNGVPDEEYDDDDDD